MQGFGGSRKVRYLDLAQSVAEKPSRDHFSEHLPAGIAWKHFKTEISYRHKCVTPFSETDAAGRPRALLPGQRSTAKPMPKIRKDWNHVLLTLLRRQPLGWL